MLCSRGRNSHLLPARQLTGPLASQETPSLQHSNKTTFTKFHKAKRPHFKSCSNTRHNVKALAKAFSTTHPLVCNSLLDSTMLGSYLTPSYACSGSSSPKPHSLNSILHHTDKPPGQEQPLMAHKMHRRSFPLHFLHRGIQKSS